MVRPWLRRADRTQAEAPSPSDGERRVERQGRQRSRAMVQRASSVGQRRDAEAGPGRHGEPAVVELERLGHVVLEVAARRRQVAGDREAGQRRERDQRGATDTGLEHAARARARRRRRRTRRACARASASPPTSPALMLTTVHAPSSIASRAIRALGDRLVEADRRAQPGREPRVVEERVGRERLLEARDVERVERREVVGVGERVAPVRVDLQHDTSGPTSARTAATTSTS